MPKNNNKRKNLKGGKGSGHDVHLPSEFFGKNSGRYSEKASILPPSAYGIQHATSHGMLIGNNMTGPDLGPVRPDGDHSGTQTGGKKKRRKRRKSKRQNQRGG